MKKTIVYFRADGNSQIGLGHIVRCLAIVEMLGNDFECHFLIQHPGEALKSQILNKCQTLHDLPLSDDYLQEAKHIRDTFLNGKEILVLDGYHFDTQYQNILREKNSKLVFINDIPNLHFTADVIINHTAGIQIDDFSFEPYTKLCLGTNYALVREPFRKASIEERKIQDISKLFICFGGADMFNLTQKALQASIASERIQEIHVVIGGAYPHEASLKEFISQNSKSIHLHQNLSADQMQALMQTCHLAIAPASGISYELCCVGIGLISGYYADNQMRLEDYLLENNLAFSINDFRNYDFEKLTYLIDSLDANQLNDQVQAQKNLFIDSSLAIQKVFRKISSELNYGMRKAQLDDLMLYYEWANDSEVRQFAVNSESIPLETHQNWFQNKISSDQSFLYVFLKDNQAIGQIRFDRSEDNCYEITYSVDLTRRRTGLAEIIMRMGIVELSKEVKPLNLRGLIKSEAKAQMKVVTNLSFQHVGQTTQKNIVLEVFLKNAKY